MLSKEWLEQNRINDAWTPTSAEETRKRILQYFEKRNREGDRNWLSEVHRYSHMPAVHGGLINRRYLFLGICRWDRGDLGLVIGLMSYISLGMQTTGVTRSEYSIVGLKYATASRQTLKFLRGPNHHSENLHAENHQVGVCPVRASDERTSVAIWTAASNLSSVEAFRGCVKILQISGHSRP